MTYEEKMYLEWFNDFLTVGCFAEYHLMSKETAEYIINKGKQDHEKRMKIL